MKTHQILLYNKLFHHNLVILLKFLNLIQEIQMLITQHYLSLLIQYELFKLIFQNMLHLIYVVLISMVHSIFIKY